MKKTLQRTILTTLLATALVVLSAQRPALALTYGPVAVDGSTSEWNLVQDYYADMYRAGISTKQVESRLFLRYDCPTGTLNTLVLVADGVLGLPQAQDAYVKVMDLASSPIVSGSSGDDGVAPDFAWVGASGSYVLGFEASAQLAPGSYSGLNVHLQVEDGGSQTSAVANRSIPLVIDCDGIVDPPPPPPPPPPVEEIVIGDFVWEDLDGDGIQDESEPGLGGVLVSLYDAEGLLVTTTLTDASGAWSFTVLPGAYSIAFTAPDGFFFTEPGQGGFDLDSDADADGLVPLREYLADETIDVDAGLYRLATLGDRVWLDRDADGILEEGENGLGGVEVTLFDAEGDVVGTQITSPEGFYAFLVKPGEYSIGFALPETFFFSPADQGEDDGLDSDADVQSGRTLSHVLVSGQYDATLDAGLFQLASLGGTVFVDSDADGQFDVQAGELPKAGATVNLFDCEGALVATTVTDATGYYVFGDLVPGCFTVELDLASIGGGYVLTTSGALSVALYSGDDITDLDFGIRPLVSPGTGTPGYWMNHSEAWPVTFITIGGVVYTVEQAIALMKKPTAGDVTLSMFQALVSAKLNVGLGNDSSCIEASILTADAWLAKYPVGSRVKAGGATSPWRVGQPIYNLLDAYNNGLLCAPHRG